MTFVHPAYIDLNGKTYLLGDFKINDQDFSQFPLLELLDPEKPNEREFGKTKLIHVYKITTEHCKPRKGIFEDPSHVVRTIIQIIDNLDIHHLLVRTQQVKSKGDMLEII